MTALHHIKGLDDVSLLTCLAALAKAERQCQVDLLMHLAEVDERKLYLGQGYSSLWDFCRRALLFSESVSQQRIALARAIRGFPGLLPLLADGRLTLCTAADLIPALTAETAERLLEQAAGKSRRQVQELAETRGAKPRERDVIRRLAPAVPTPLALAAPDISTEAKSGPATAAESTKPTPKAPLEPAKPRHRIAFTASDEVVKKLERLKELLGAATLEDAVGKAADALLDRLDPVRRQARRQKRQGKPVATPRPARRKQEPRRPPLPLRDAVMVRDDLQCAFVSPDGVRCTETRFLTIDHVHPYALGGTSTDQSNLRNMCNAHNGYLGRLVFGPRPKVPRQATGQDG